MSQSSRNGFTLVELLVYVTIFTIVIIGVISVFVEVLNIQSHESGKTQVNQESQFLIQQIQYNIETARLADMPLDTATSTLQLREFSLSVSPTLIYASGGVVYIQQGLGGTPVPLTSSNVTVSNISFTRHYNIGSSTIYGADSVSYSFTMGVNVSNTLQQYTGSFQSAALVLTPVPKIALIQKTSNAIVATSTSISSTYASYNESGDLLVAVVANNGTTSVTVTDSASNTWNKIASSVFAAYGDEMMIFDALNSANSSNTVTATFGTGESSSSIFLYEYRGASTSTSFDASSSALDPDTQTPSSSLANATSAAEIVIGATENENTAEIPAAGTGFTMETSSTVTSVFVEDEPMFITVPVAATWQYSATTPSSSALVVTFK